MRQTGHEARSKDLRQIADAQMGYFAAGQARSLGYACGSQGHRAAKGEWTRVDRGLFRLTGYPDTPESKLIRWCLWSRNQKDEIQAIISHESALEHHGLANSTAGKVHLTVAGTFRKKIPNEICVYRVSLKPGDYEDHGPFRVTTPLQTLKDMAETLREQGRFEETVRLALEKGLVTREALRGEGLLPENFGREIRPANVAQTAPDENKQKEGYTTAQSAPQGLPQVAQQETASAQAKVDEGDSGGKMEEDAAQMPQDQRELDRIITIAVQKVLEEAEKGGFTMNKKEKAAEPLKTNSPREEVENEQKQAAPSAEPAVAEPILHTVRRKRPLFAEEVAGQGHLEEGAKMEREKAEEPSRPLFKGKLKSCWSMPAREKVYSTLGSRAAFTLVELLVVIAIMSILMGLLLPALAKVNAVARQTACGSNLRQDSLMIHMYADDHRELFPAALAIEPGSNPPQNWAWARTLWNLDYGPEPVSGAPSVFFCPTLQIYDAINFSNQRYGMWRGDAAYGPISPYGGDFYYISRAKAESNRLLVADSIVKGLTPSPQWYGLKSGTGIMASSWGSVHLRHGKHAMSLFAGGHVAAKDAGWIEDDGRYDWQY